MVFTKNDFDSLPCAGLWVLRRFRNPFGQSQLFHQIALQPLTTWAPPTTKTLIYIVVKLGLAFYTFKAGFLCI